MILWQNHHIKYDGYFSCIRGFLRMSKIYTYYLPILLLVGGIMQSHDGLAQENNNNEGPAVKFFEPPVQGDYSYRGL